MKSMLLFAVLLSAAPAAAQLPAPGTPGGPALVVPPVPPIPPRPPHAMRASGTMTETGRATMMGAMRGDAAADRADRERVRASRDRMLAVLDAERLDTVALRRAMDDERDAANAMKVRRQAAMATAFTALSAADRKAFVADARSMRDRVERRVERKVRRGMRAHKEMRMMAPDASQ